MVSLSPLPQLDLHSRGAESPDLHPTFLTSSLMDQLPLSADGETSASKRWSSDDAVMMPPKRACLHPCSSSLPEVPTVEQLNRQQQEEEDRRLALLLQKELDQEERRAVDRRKGSSDAYPLRLTRQAQESSSSSTSRKTTSSAPKASAAKTSSRPRTSSSTTASSPSACSGRRQATLTEMFSGFSS